MEIQSRIKQLMLFKEEISEISFFMRLLEI